MSFLTSKFLWPNRLITNHLPIKVEIRSQMSRYYSLIVVDRFLFNTFPNVLNQIETRITTHKLLMNKGRENSYNGLLEKSLEVSLWNPSPTPTTRRTYSLCPRKRDQDYEGWFLEVPGSERKWDYFDVRWEDSEY